MTSHLNNAPQTHATRELNMFLTIADIRDRVERINLNWKGMSDNRKAHEEIDRLQVEVLHSIATAPDTVSRGELREMARLISDLDIEGANFKY